MRDFRDRLQGSLDAIGQVEVEQVEGRAAFDGRSLIQVWMVHPLVIIGEAVRSIDPAVPQRYPCIPWRPVAGVRNILVHDSFRINQEIVWENVEKHIPPLKAEIQAILSSLPQG